MDYGLEIPVRLDREINLPELGGAAKLEALGVVSISVAEGVNPAPPAA